MDGVEELKWTPLQERDRQRYKVYILTGWMMRPLASSLNSAFAAVE